MVAREGGRLRRGPAAAHQRAQAGEAGEHVLAASDRRSGSARRAGGETRSPPAAGAAPAERSATGVSVVPTTTRSCQGTAKSTRPSSVWGTRMALAPGWNRRSSTRWTPWLGARSVGLSGSSIRRRPSDEDAGGVHHYAGPHLRLGSSFFVAHESATDQALLLVEPHGADVVHGHATQVRQGAGEGHGEPGVIELGVLIDDAAAQPLRVPGWACGRASPRGRAGERARGPCGRRAGRRA